jgi:acyl carrier protein
MFEDVRKLIADYIGVNPEEVHSDMSLKNDYGLDSTEIIDIASRLQKRFGKTLPIQLFKNCDSVTEICQYMQGITA